MQTLHREIVEELYRSLVLLGAQSDLLGTVGSWGDSLPDHAVLSGLRCWNHAMFQEIKQRIEHYEISGDGDYNRVEFQKNAPVRL
jgi:hypothetical protein